MNLKRTLVLKSMNNAACGFYSEKRAAISWIFIERELYMESLDWSSVPQATNTMRGFSALFDRLSSKLINSRTSYVLMLYVMVT